MIYKNRVKESYIPSNRSDVFVESNYGDNSIELHQYSSDENKYITITIEPNDVEKLIVAIQQLQQLQGLLQLNTKKD